MGVLSQFRSQSSASVVRLRDRSQYIRPTLALFNRAEPAPVLRQPVCLAEDCEAFFACGHASLVAQNRHAGSAPPAWEFYRSLARSLLRAVAKPDDARRISGSTPALFDRPTVRQLASPTYRVHFFAN